MLRTHGKRMAEVVISRKILQGKVAIVTGGASGIGEATARRFVDHGLHALVIADVQDEKGQKVAESIGPHRCSYIHCDVADEEEVKTLVDTTVQLYGGVDIFFSNAGIVSQSDQTILDLNLSEYDKIMTVNARGMAACVKHAARAMVEGSVRGSIVCTASLASERGAAFYTDYTMSKHAVLGLVRSASLQLGPHGIRVNCVSPGAVGTPLLRKLLGVETIEGSDLEKVVACRSYLTGALKEKNIADAVVFLASDNAEFVTGINLVVDGGFRPPQNEPQGEKEK